MTVTVTQIDSEEQFVNTYSQLLKATEAENPWGVFLATKVILSSQYCTEQMIEQLWDEQPLVKEIIPSLLPKQTSLGLFQKINNSITSSSLRRVLLANPHLPLTVLEACEKYATPDDPRILISIATHDNATDDLLMRLIKKNDIEHITVSSLRVIVVHSKNVSSALKVKIWNEIVTRNVKLEVGELISNTQNYYK